MSELIPVRSFFTEFELEFSSEILIDWYNASTQSVVLAGNAEITIKNFLNGIPYRLFVTQGPDGGNTITFTNDIKWPKGTTPILATTGDQTDIFTFIASRSVVFADCTSKFYYDDTP